MNAIPKISESEWKIMKIIWGKSSCNANEIITALKSVEAWSPKTIKSLISRLLKKKVIDYEQVGRTYKYYPMLSEEECAKFERKSFLQRVYNGSLKTMFLNFIQDGPLSIEELDELKHMLEERKE